MGILNKDIVPIIFADLKIKLQNTRQVTNFAKTVGLARSQLYCTLNNKHKPSYDVLLNILDKAGFDIFIKRRILELNEKVKDNE